ncbi:MAG: hypothetical protein HEP71_29160 [Roseivirga sp.]|nr:hypothetical protein [Roseivirga sp.]
MKKIILVLTFTSVLNVLYGQDDLLQLLEEETVEETFETPAFKAMKIGNLQSTKVAMKGELYMYVSHRFGTLKNADSTFFGLDNANTKIQMVYGLMNGLQIGMSRESLRRTFAGSVKFSLKRRGKAFPVNLTAYSTVNLNTELSKERYPGLRYSDRLSYTTQLLISRKLNHDLTLQVAPTFVRQNLVFESFQDHEQFALGFGGRQKLNQRISLNLDYVYNFSRADRSIYHNPLTIGLNIETGGHVFQLLFSNAQSTNEPGFISNAEGDWGEGDIFFGFNIVRVF